MTLHFVIPGDLEIRTGGYGYDRRIIREFRRRGCVVEVIRLDDSFPEPTAVARAHAAAALAAIPGGSTVLMDGLALGALPDEVAREAERLTIVALVHHPLADETGIDPALAAALDNSERRALAAARRVVVTSRATAATLVARFGVALERIAIVEPGTDPAPLATRVATRVVQAGKPGTTDAAAPPAMDPRHSEVALLCVATLTPRKGYEILFDALAAIPQRHWRLTCAGSLDRDAATVARLRARLHDRGLEERVRFAGDLDATALSAEYDRADLFVLPTLYEGYGMAVAEALARGLPIVSTATGAIEDLVTGRGMRPGDLAAGLIVPPGDTQAFTFALSRAIGDPVLRGALTANARMVREQLPTWQAAAAAMERAVALDREVTR